MISVFLLLVIRNQPKVGFVELTKPHLQGHPFSFVVLLNAPHEGLDLFLLLLEFIVAENTKVTEALIEVLDFVFFVEQLLLQLVHFILHNVLLLPGLGHIQELGRPVKKCVILPNFFEFLGASFFCVFFHQVVQDGLLS